MIEIGKETVVRCEGVWKLFGAGARRLLDQHGNGIADEALKQSGTIVGVRDVSLEIARGEVFVVMGLSGSGKSTLLRLMTGLQALSAGRLRLFDAELASIAERDLLEIRRHRISMVFQQFALLPHLTAIGNVAFPLRMQGIARSAREQKAREMLALVGLSGREDHFPHELSGGQQQRVGLARSLTTDPEIWFLDEPFSALDPLIRAEMQDELLRLQGMLQKTIVFVTHDIDEAIRLASRIAIMRDGRVLQIGSPEDLVLAPADDYVARFVRDIPRAKVLTARALAGPVTMDLETQSPVAAGAKLEAIARRMLDATRPVAVIDDAGRTIGALSRTAVLDAIL